jgi:hypothetical protein
MDSRETNHKWWTSFDSKSMMLIVEDSDGNEIAIPARYAVCSVCNGKGTHVNPSIDSNGLSSEDFEDRDFEEDYFSGIYDVPCNNCRGERVEPVADLDSLLPEERKVVEDIIKFHYEYQAEIARERKFGC